MRTEGVSSAVGAIMLIGVAVLAMGIVMLFFFSSPLPTSVPAFTGIISNSSKTVYISHEGGDSLRVGQFKILVDGVDETGNFTKSLTGNFSVGKVMNATLPKYASRVVMVFNTSYGGETVLLSANLYGSLPFTPPGWYSSSWLYRKKITILGSKVSGSHSNFPVLIYLTGDLDLQNDALAGGNDILFTSWDGTTKIPHEIEWFNKQSGALTVWVKVPSVSAGSDTVVYVYYDNPNAASQQDPRSVWTNNFAGVWHLNASFADSTSNANNGTNVGSTDTAGASAGALARARNFASASSQYIDIPSPGTSLNITGTALTVSAWINANTWRNPYYLGTIYDKASWPSLVTSGYNLRAGSSGGSGRASFLFGNGTTAWAETYSDPVMSTGTWYYLTGTYDGSYARIYINGAQVNSTAVNTAITNSLYSPQIADNQFPRVSGQDARYFNGIIDEVRVSGVTRSGDWIATEYANMNSPSTFYTITSEQSPLTMT